MSLDTTRSGNLHDGLLTAKVAFVTGAGSGIGRAGAMAMARAGARVIVSDVDGTRAARVATDLTDEGFCATSMALDVLDDEALTTALVDSAREFGRLDVLHSHAGYQAEGNLEQVGIDDMDMSWRLNVRAHFIAARAAGLSRI